MSDTTRIRLAGAVALGFFAVALVSGAVWWLWGLTRGPDWNRWDRDHSPDLFEMARATATVTAIIGAGVGVVLACRRNRSNEA